MPAKGHRSPGRALRIEVGRTIQRLREAKALTQKELGARLGTTGSGVGAMERGANLTLSTIENLADALGVPPAALFAGSKPFRVAKERRSIARLLETLRPESDEVVESVEAVARTIVKALHEPGQHRRGRR